MPGADTSRNFTYELTYPICKENGIFQLTSSILYQKYVKVWGRGIFFKSILSKIRDLGLKMSKILYEFIIYVYVV